MLDEASEAAMEEVLAEVEWPLDVDDEGIDEAIDERMLAVLAAVGGAAAKVRIEVERIGPGPTPFPGGGEGGTDGRETVAERRDRSVSRGPRPRRTDHRVEATSSTTADHSQTSNESRKTPGPAISAYDSTCAL